MNALAILFLSTLICALGGGPSRCIAIPTIPADQASISARVWDSKARYDEDVATFHRWERSAPNNRSTNNSNNSSINSSINNSTKNSDKNSTNNSTDSSNENSNSSPVKNSTNSSANNSTNSSTNNSTNRLTNNSTNSSNNNSTNSSTNNSTDSSIDNSTSSPVKNSTDSSIDNSTSSPVKNSTNSSTNGKNVTQSSGSELPTNVTDVVRAIDDLFSTIESMLLCWIDLDEPDSSEETSESVEVSLYVIERRRRALLQISDLLPKSLASIVQLLIDYLHKSMNSVQDLIGYEISSISDQVLDTVINFVFTAGLPVLHSVLDRLEETNSLPASLNNLIDQFNSVYDLLKFLGFVKSSID